MSEAIQFTRITNSNGNMTKRVGLTKGGGIQKDSSQCRLSKGTSERIHVTDMEGVANAIGSLEKCQAIVCGITDKEKVDVVSRRLEKKYPDAITRTKDYFSWPTDHGIFPIDYDPHPNCPVKPESPRELLDALSEADPQLKGASMVRTYSTSSGLYLDDAGIGLGEIEIVPQQGMHLYLEWETNGFKKCPLIVGV